MWHPVGVTTTLSPQIHCVFISEIFKIFSSSSAEVFSKLWLTLVALPCCATLQYIPPNCNFVPINRPLSVVLPLSPFQQTTVPPFASETNLSAPTYEQEGVFVSAATESNCVKTWTLPCCLSTPGWVKKAQRCWDTARP